MMLLTTEGDQEGSEHSESHSGSWSWQLWWLAQRPGPDMRAAPNATPYALLKGQNDFT